MKNFLKVIGLLLLIAACTGNYRERLEPSDPSQISRIERVILADLPDSLLPKQIYLRDRIMPTSYRIDIKSANNAVFQVQNRPFQSVAVAASSTQRLSTLQDESGKLILDLNGKPFLLGKGGTSWFKNFNSDNGLVIDAVSCGIMDRRGHLWFGTAGGGVSRFDGATFTTYSQVEGLADNSIKTIFEDSKGTIWIGTLGWGVSSFDGQKFDSYSTGDGLANDYVYTISEDSKGNIWFGTDGGISKYDGVEFENYTTEDGLPSNSIVSIREGPNGSLWIGTEGSGVAVFDGQAFKNYTTADGLPSNRIRSIMVDSADRIWFGTIGGGVAILDSDGFSVIGQKQGLSSMVVKHILEDQFGKFWFATENGLGRLEGDQVVTYTREQGLPSNNINHIIEDRDGRLWLSTEGGGISRFAGDSFTNFTTSQGLANNFVMTVLEDSDGSYWFGTSGGGVSHFKDDSFTNYGATSGLASDLVNSSLLDRNGNIWFGTGGGGVTFFDRKSFTTYSVPQGLPYDEVYSIFEAGNGDIWFGTDGGGVSKFDGESFTNYNTTHGLAGDAILGIEQDNAGNFWFSAADGGLSRFDGQSFVNFYDKQGLGENSVFRALNDQKGNLWVATYNGLSFLTADKLNSLDSLIDFDSDFADLFQTFRSSDGLPDNVILQIINFSEDKIAIGTNKGIAIFDIPTDSLPSELKNIEIFNSDGGYPVKDLTDGDHAMILDSKGVIWAGTGNIKTALLRFDYKSLLKNQAIPDLLFKQLRINEEVISWQSLDGPEGDSLAQSSRNLNELLVYGKTLNTQERTDLGNRFKNIEFDFIHPFFPVPEGLILPFRHNHINIDYGTAELSNPSLLEYQYILENYDTEWSPVLTKTSATFGNIQEGDYSFKVRARFIGAVEGAAGQWTEPISYNFAVLPPWYRTWWAFTFYILGFLTLIYPLSIYNKNQAIKAEKDKAQERELAHAKEIEKAYKNLKSTQSQLIQAEKMASLGELTAGIAHEIQNPLNFVNNFSEVSSELILEMNEDIANGKLEDAKIIAEDIRQNLDRITLHGRRADSIVKAMLQHSRSGIGQKERTDINAISEECLRLSYHGIRAKDKEFHSEYLTSLDPEVPQLQVIPRDIRKVLLNIYSNAFYAVAEYDKELRNGGEKNPEDGYTPIVSVTTKKMADGVEIRISDNGKGISSTIKDKVFQPFFTTKPTGKGTGLGLSLSYDIIKAHGGNLTVESPPSSGRGEIKQGAEFIITLPLDENNLPEYE